MRILARREHSESELKRKLKQNGYTPDEIAPTLTTLREMNYLSDERFARVYLKSLVQSSFGMRRIQNKFKEKGLVWDAELYSEVLLDLGILPDNQITHWIEKKSRMLKPNETREKKFQKLITFLIGKGFGFDESKRAVAKALDQKTPD
jgi:regulatory protein